MSSGQRDVISAEPRPVPYRRAWVIAAVVAAALAAALVTVVRDHGRPASPVTACGHGLVPGYADHRSYPPGIPTLPPPGPVSSVVLPASLRRLVMASLSRPLQGRSSSAA